MGLQLEPVKSALAAFGKGMILDSIVSIVLNRYYKSHLLKIWFTE